MGACLRLDVGLDGLAEGLQRQDAERLLNLPGTRAQVRPYPNAT